MDGKAALYMRAEGAFGEGGAAGGVHFNPKINHCIQKPMGGQGHGYRPQRPLKPSGLVLFVAPAITMGNVRGGGVRRNH